MANPTSNQCSVCERSMSVLQLYGVPPERARNPVNGIEVLMTRSRKEAVAVNATIERLRAALDRIARFADPGLDGANAAYMRGIAREALSGDSPPPEPCKPCSICGSTEHSHLHCYGPVHETKSKWKCGADRSGIGGNMPQDCDWPYCGCDETATKVIEALQEQGWMPVPRPASMPNRVRPEKSPNKSGVEYIRELVTYCGLTQQAIFGIPFSRELEFLLEHLANAQDDALQLHHAYVDLKYPQSAPSAQETPRERLRDSDAAFNLGVLPTEQPEKASANGEKP